MTGGVGVFAPVSIDGAGVGSTQATGEGAAAPVSTTAGGVAPVFSGDEGGITGVSGFDGVS